MAMNNIKIRTSDDKEIDIQAFYLMTYSQVFRDMISNISPDQAGAVPVEENPTTWSWLTRSMVNGGDIVTPLTAFDDIVPILKAIDKYEAGQLKTRLWTASRVLLEESSDRRERGALAVRLAKLAAQDDREELFKHCVRAFCPSQYLHGESFIDKSLYLMDFNFIDDDDAVAIGGKYLRALGAASDTVKRDRRGLIMDWDAVADRIKYRPREAEEGMFGPTVSNSRHAAYSISQTETAPPASITGSVTASKCG